MCTIETGRGRPSVPAEVVGFRAGRTLLMALGEAVGIGPGARVTASGEPLTVNVCDALLGRALDGLGRPLDGKGPIPNTMSRPAEASPPDPLPPAHRGPCVARRARAGRDGPLRARPASRHLRRLRRRQVLAAGHDRPLDLRGDQRDLPGRRARSRGARVHGARPRPRGPRALGRGLRHLRPARAGAPEGRVHGDRDRGVLPRPGPQRAADDGLGHALRDGPARGRPGDRRAAGHARLHAVGVRDAPEAARARRHLAQRARSPRSTRCSSTATT